MKSLPLLLVLVFLLTACAAPPPAPDTPAAQTQSIAVYAYNPALDTDSAGNIMCTAAGLVAVPRELDAALQGEARLRAAIELLLAGGLTPAETEQGLTTEFPLTGLTLESLTLADAALTLTFNDPDFQTSGGACRVSILYAQLEATARQFGDVTTLHIQPDEAFQP